MKKGKAKVGNNTKVLGICEDGISTASQFAAAMSALMSDLAAERISHQTANAICNAGGKLLKIVEMQYRYGPKGKEAPKNFLLVEKVEQPLVQ